MLLIDGIYTCMHMLLLEHVFSERCNPWPHVANRHISISQLLSLRRHSHYDVIRLGRAQPPFSFWRQSHCDVIRYWTGHAHHYRRTYVTYGHLTTFNTEIRQTECTGLKQSGKWKSGVQLSIKTPIKRAWVCVCVQHALLPLSASVLWMSSTLLPPFSIGNHSSVEKNNELLCIFCGLHQCLTHMYRRVCHCYICYQQIKETFYQFRIILE